MREPIQVLAEVKPGIDPTTSKLITDPNEYWLTDETNTCTLTHFSGDILGNLWKITGNTLELNDNGTTSENWELDGTILNLKA